MIPIQTHPGFSTPVEGRTCPHGCCRLPMKHAGTTACGRCARVQVGSWVRQPAGSRRLTFSLAIRRHATAVLQQSDWAQEACFSVCKLRWETRRQPAIRQERTKGWYRRSMAGERVPLCRAARFIKCTPLMPRGYGAAVVGSTRQERGRGGKLELLCHAQLAAESASWRGE